MAKKTAKKSRKKGRPKPDQVVKAILAGNKAIGPQGKASKQGFAKAAELTKKATENKYFNYHLTAADGVPVHYFHRIGERLTGIIGSSQRAVIQRGVVTSHEYLVPIVLDHGQLYYLPNNTHLRELLKAADCWFQRVTIVYKGKIQTAHGHHKKVYEVQPAPLGKDGVGPEGRDILAKAAAETAETKKRRRAKA